MDGYPFSPFDDQTVLPAFPMEIPALELPDLSFHEPTLDPELKVRVDTSAASNHRDIPGILRGLKPEYVLVVPKMTGIGYLV
jgi:hypothetical protein